MAEEIKRAKAIRTAKKGNFTRKKTHLQQLLDGGANSERLNASYAELADAYKTLEQAHEDVLVVIEEDQIEHEETYLNEQAALLSEMDVKVITACEAHDQNRLEQQQQKKLADDESDKKRSLERALTLLKTSISTFGKPSENLAQLSKDKVISFADMRLEIDRLGERYSEIIKEKVNVLSLDDTIDLAEINEQLESLVVSEIDKCRRIGLEYMKDMPAAPTVTTAAIPTGGGSGPGGGFSATKRETVMLPKFSGDEKTAYLRYPVWKQQWSNHITEYEEKYRATMLLNHLDAKALEQIVGLENQYEKAMTQLDKYYNDAKKLVKACLDEIKAHSVISAHDYKALVAYKKCLVNNFTRLEASDLSHEMSNTAALSVLIRKLPIQEAVKWQEFLSKQNRDAQAKPFPSFLLWLEEAGNSWELLAASGTGAKTKGGVTQVHHSFYNDGDDADSSKEGKPCFKCGESGHWKRDCPKASPNRGGKSTGGGKVVQAKNSKDRPVLKHKKFHCAFHKGAPGKNCSTWSCAAIKYTPYDERLKLLKSNGDCELCCGDCPKGNCQSKIRRTCGGGKDGRGCGSNHLGHELFCQSAKLCFSTQLETVLRADDDCSDGVLLLVMKIQSISPDLTHETVLWDSACSGMFVRQNHAEKMGFPYKEKKLKVATLGGQITEIDGRIYECTIRDQKGKTYTFSAHGLEQVTGDLGKPLEKSVMKRLFPNVCGAHTLTSDSEVDYLIGLAKASWQPEKIQKAEGGGDFWLWQNDFGTCVGGSHPLVNSFTCRSDSLYTVLKTVIEDDPVIDSMKIPTCPAYATKVSITECGDFFNTEKLGTIVEPRCGSCKCGKCPVPGSRYSFREESELKMIEDNLSYDEAEGCWVTSYPFLFSKDLLKGSKEVAIKSMVATEKTLCRKGD